MKQKSRVIAAHNIPDDVKQRTYKMPNQMFAPLTTRNSQNSRLSNSKSKIYARRQERAQNNCVHRSQVLECMNSF